MRIVGVLKKICQQSKSFIKNSTSTKHKLNLIFLNNMELDTFRFKLPEFLTPVRHWPKYDLTSKRHVRCTPQTLYTLCSFVKDDFPMLSHFKWSNAEVLEWIEQLGYPQYKVCPSQLNQSSYTITFLRQLFVRT